MPPVSSGICVYVHLTTKHRDAYWNTILGGLQRVWKASPTCSWQFSSCHSLLGHRVRPRGQCVLFESIRKPSITGYRRPSGGQCGPERTLIFEVGREEAKDVRTFQNTKVSGTAPLSPHSFFLLRQVVYNYRRELGNYRARTGGPSLWGWVLDLAISVVYFFFINRLVDRQATTS